MVYIWSLRWMYPFFLFLFVCCFYVLTNMVLGFFPKWHDSVELLHTNIAPSMVSSSCLRTFRLESLTGRCRLQNSNITKSSFWKTIYRVQFQSYDMCSSMSAFASRRRGGRTWRINCISNTIAGFSISCVPSITRACVWTHGILANGIEVTGMGTSGTFIQV